MQKIEPVFVNGVDAFKNWLLSLGLAPGWVDFAIVLLGFIVIALIITLNMMVLIWLERKISGFIQERLGPNRLGPFGIFQTIADSIKLLTKEDIIPSAADRWVFITAPIFLVTVSVMLYLVIPLGDGLQVLDYSLGLLYFLSIASVGTIALLMAGWGSNNKWTLIGSLRSVAQMVSYEIPLILSIVGIVMITGSLKLSDIIAAQGNIWFIVLQPIAFFVFFIAATAELNRGPFDMPEAEQELTAGAFTEYTGMRWALFFLAEYTNLVAMSALIAILFLGGWQGPLLPSWIWIILKTYFVMIVFMWLKWTLPRIRMDHLMAFCWKVLIPVALVNIVLTGAGIHLFRWIGWW